MQDREQGIDAIFCLYEDQDADEQPADGCTSDIKPLVEKTTTSVKTSTTAILASNTFTRPRIPMLITIQYMIAMRLPLAKDFT
jgi:hypothetical protein